LLKIIQLIQKAQLRGAEIFASQLSNHLNAEGHDVHMICMLRGDAILPFKGNLIKLNRPAGKRMMDIRGWRLFAIHIRNINPDVVQANAGDTLKFAVFSKLFFGWKTPIVFRNANKVSDFIDSVPKLLFNKFLVNRLSHVISVSELCRKDFVKTYSFEAAKTTTVPIGIEREAITTAIPDDIKAVFVNSTVLVHVGSFVPEKNHIGLMRITKRLLDSGADVKVLLIGDGKLKQWIQQQATEMDLASRVFFVGYRTDVLSIVANAKALLMTSKIEGLPAVILEAMHCRTPVIAFDVGGISEAVRPRETGWLVNAADESAFVAAIQEMLGAHDMHNIKEKAYNLVVNEYDNRTIAKRFLAVYYSVVNRDAN
jgi:glycosyltransferase involved in cell wall biosynthesis